MNMSINKASSYFNAIRGELRQLTNEERISSNNQKIAALEEQLAAEKESRIIIKEMISNNEALISNSNRKIDILEQLKASSDRLIGAHQEQRGLLQESRDLNQKMINVMEKMIAIMMKNPAKYGGLSNTEIQKRPEVIEAKTQVTQLANSKVEQYPKKERAMLTNTVKDIVDVTFTEIKSTPTDIEIDKALFSNLPKRIEAALDKKHEALSVKEFRKLVDANYKSLENFFRIKRLDYLDLALKDIKV